MNHLLHLFSSLAFILLFGTAFGYTGNTIPPDSTTGIIDKSAAIIMIEEGRGLFGEGKVKDALIRFREASNKDLNSYKAVYWISACHYNLNNYGYALKYAKKAYAMNPEKITSEIYVVLGESYHRLGIVDSAIMNYNLALEKLSKSRSRVLLIQHHIDECNFVIEQSKKEVKDIKSRLEGDVNSGYDDYGALIRDNGKTLYFTSRRSNTTGGGMNPDDQLYFEDIYKVVWDGEMKEWSDVTNKIPRLNSDGFDALNVISDDGLTGVITLNSTATDAETVTRGSDLCEIKLNKKGDWNRPRAIKNKSINTSYFDGAATVTADGSTMYFVSDRKGEKSSTDIYRVEKVGKKWGKAEQLPMTINTTGRETTPYISADGRYLFFSSNGRVGMGGFDVYVVENRGGEWGQPVNLGHNINGVTDDTHFSYSSELKKGFMSGFRIVGQKASIDIYEVDMTDFSFPKQ